MERRVLLAVENEALMGGIADWLATSPDIVLVGRAHSGAEAIDRAMRLQPDLVIVDGTLQDMTGFEAAHALKSMKPAPRVLITTFLESRFVKLAAQTVGADGIMTHTEIPEKLLPKIAELFAPGEETTFSKFERRDSKMRGILRGLMGIVALATVAGAAHATTLNKINLVGLLREADSIVVGDVASVADGTTEIGLPYTEVTVNVSEQLRGSDGDTLVFRQIGLQTPKSNPDGNGMTLEAPEGVPHYTVGEHVVLFLNPKAEMTGLRTPVGLGTGKFVIGSGEAENGYNNSGVFQDVTIAGTLANDNDKRILETSFGAVNPDDFVSLVRRAVQNSWVENCLMYETSVGKTCIDRPLPGKGKLGSTGQPSTSLNTPKGPRTGVPGVR